MATPRAYLIDAPTGSQVKKAGQRVRRALRSTQLLDQQELNDAIAVIAAHRATFRQPLLGCNNALRSMVTTLKIDGQVSQRLKRMPTILNKVTREPTLALNKMQDIGGCRVVVPDRADVYKLAERIAANRQVLDCSDYIVAPRQSGYRGIHLVVEYGRLPRPIEVQLRTHGMHVWATTVENISGNVGINYKMDGTDPMQVFLECLARVLEHNELGRALPSQLSAEYDRLLEDAFGRRTP